MANTTKRRRENTAHSLDHLRGLGYFAEVVERWDPRTMRRKDLFGLMDILAVRPGEILGVQVGSLNGRSSHKTKILGEPRAWDWIGSGSRLIIHSWDRVEVPTIDLGALSPMKMEWQLTEDEILPIHLGLDEDRIQAAVLERLGWEVTS